MSGFSFIRKPFKYTFSNAAFAVIIANIAVYMLTAVNPSLKAYLSLNAVCLVQGKMFWQPLSYMFVHGDFPHLLFNMLGILFFGTAVERSLGSKEFLLLYFICGIGAGLFSAAAYLISGAYYVFLMGASGAVYGVLLAYAVIFPRSRIFIWGALPVPAPLLILIYAVAAVMSQLFGRAAGIAHMTHLAGFAVMWLYFIIRMGVNPYKVWKDAYR